MRPLLSKRRMPPFMYKLSMKSSFSFIFQAFCLYLCLAQLHCLPTIIKSSYNNADYLFLLEMDQYFDTTNKQEVYIKEKFSSLHNWHRTKELPRYLKLLKYIKRQVQNKKEAQAIPRILARVRNFGFRLIGSLYPDSIDFLLSLKKEQIQNLEEELIEANEKLEERLALSPREYQEERRESILEKTEDWIGSLSAEQEKILSNKIKSLPSISKERLRFRNQRRVQLLKVLRAKGKGIKRLKNLITAWTRDYPQSIPPFYKKAQRRYRKHLRDYLSTVAKIATPRQRKYFIKKLSNYEKVLIELIEKK